MDNEKKCGCNEEENTCGCGHDNDHEHNEECGCGEEHHEHFVVDLEDENGNVKAVPLFHESLLHKHFEIKDVQLF